MDEHGNTPKNTDKLIDDKVAAIISIVYMLLFMVIFFWLLFDIWFKQFSIANLLGYQNTRTVLANAEFLLAAYAFIGGALGGIVNGIRSFVNRLSEKNDFHSRLMCKYIAAPWLGAALALFTGALVLGGVGVISGGSDASVSSLTTSQVLYTFALGMLAGYGGHQVFIWLDAQVKRIFQVSQSQTGLAGQ